MAHHGRVDVVAPIAWEYHGVGEGKRGTFAANKFQHANGNAEPVYSEDDAEILVRGGLLLQPREFRLDWPVTPVAVLLVDRCCSRNVAATTLARRQVVEHGHLLHDGSGFFMVERLDGANGDKGI